MILLAFPIRESSDMQCNMRLVLVIWYFMHVHCIAAVSVKKVRLCLEYVIEDYWAGNDALLVELGVTQGKCMTQCARKPPCMAFNFRPVDGNCRLLTAVTTCIKPNTTEGWLYVSLSTCDQHRPWHSIRPAENGWQWVAGDEINTGSNVVAAGHRFLSRVYYKGLYLPGWWSSSAGHIRFRAVLPGGDVVRCIIGEFLVVSNPGRVQWSPAATNHAILGNALIGGYGPDSTPFYICRKRLNRAEMFGFYNAENQVAYFCYNGYNETMPGDIIWLK